MSQLEWLRRGGTEGATDDNLRAIDNCKTMTVARSLEPKQKKKKNGVCARACACACARVRMMCACPRVRMCAYESRCSVLLPSMTF